MSFEPSSAWYELKYLNWNDLNLNKSKYEQLHYNMKRMTDDFYVNDNSFMR